MPEHIVVSEVKNHVCTIALNRPEKKMPSPMRYAMRSRKP